MSARLVGIAGPLTGAVVELTLERACIGRDAKNEIWVDDSTLSRTHCEILRDGSLFHIRDLGSHNQTYVNSLPVTELRLTHGDAIGVGRSLFLFQEGASEFPLPNQAALEEGDGVSQSTEVLRLEDARYLNPEKISGMALDSKRTARDLKCLLHASGAISSIRGLDPLAARILDLLGEAIPGRHGALLLLPYGADEWQREFHWRRDPHQQEPLRVPRGILRQILKERVAICSNDVMDDDVPVTESLLASRVSSVLAIPLIIFDHIIGAIYFDSADAAVQFDHDHLELLTGFAGIVVGPLQSALQIHELETENQRLHAEMTSDHTMVGESARLREIYAFIRKVAPSESTVLIGGESGTGKELVARAIHRNSPRSEKAFVAINCAALTDSLLESELFGHEKGAFTGAVSQKKGKIEEGAGGTLFLDEVGELAQPLQAKLLRVLQEREFERVGGTKTIKADIRLIAATNRDLKAAIDQGAFRRDLYFRLNVVAVTLPALRERREDIARLAEHFIAKHAAKSPRRVTGISPEAQECLRKYDWPGNVRELENAIERAIVLGSTSMILPEDLPDGVVDAGGGTAGPGAKFQEVLRDMKRQLVLKALRETQHRYAEAAKILGLHPNNLHRLMRNLGIKGAGSK